MTQPVARYDPARRRTLTRSARDRRAGCGGDARHGEGNSAGLSSDSRENEAERIALRPIGRNRERNREAIQGTVDIAKACESLGVWGMSQIEHHFHSEGYEVAPAPGIMNAYWAAHTERLRIGQLGYVMSNQNPIRVAEETAVLDNITNGRLFVGFARGYQDRWTNVMGPAPRIARHPLRRRCR